MKRNARKLLIFMTLVLFPFLCIVGVFSLCEHRNHGYDISIQTNGEVASLISGEFYGTSVTDEEDGLQFLDTLQREYGFDNARNEFVFDKVIDASGGKVFKYIQVHQGVPVYGRSLSVFVDENGRVISVSGNYKNTNANVVKVDLNEFETKFKTEYGIDEIFSLKPVIFNQGDNDTLAVMLNCVYDGITSDVIACYD
ncbi:MAG: hypothetical protein IJW24_03395, partial [Clostridia bacterium]|nr:hypothetical protein [Clostridia bacterium]